MPKIPRVQRPEGVYVDFITGYLAQRKDGLLIYDGEGLQRFNTIEEAAQAAGDGGHVQFICGRTDMATLRCCCGGLLPPMRGWQRCPDCGEL